MYRTNDNFYCLNGLHIATLLLSCSVRMLQLIESRRFIKNFVILQQEKSRPLPKFGEWDVNYPASADGFTVIFAKARDDKKSNGTAATMAAPPPQRNDHPQRQEQKHQYPIEVHQYLQTLSNHAALMVV